jgi:hypothetical protein
VLRIGLNGFTVDLTIYQEGNPLLKPEKFEVAGVFLLTGAKL